NRVNGVAKNRATGRRYKEIVRALKRLENDMVKTGRIKDEVHGYFIECLLYNVPNEPFMRSTYKASTMAVLATVWQNIEDDRHVDSVEVNALKWLWRDGQKWTADEASDFTYKAWNYINSG